MLHIETVESDTFSLLKRLLQMPALKNFSLVGGTALSLYYGHRISVDLDLFSHEAFDNVQIEEALRTEFGDEFQYKGNPAVFGIFCFIQNVKVDIVRYPHLPLFEPKEADGIRMYAPEDIAAMKVNAILGRGKKKDFWDISELLKHFSVENIMDWHKQKFPNQMLLISIPHALTYFVEADESEDPISLKEQTWENVQKHIQKEVREYLS
jgi:predicted nucleotidyltransferase component of viral defense system